MKKICIFKIICEKQDVIDLMQFDWMQNMNFNFQWSLQSKLDINFFFFLYGAINMGN